MNINLETCPQARLSAHKAYKCSLKTLTQSLQSAGFQTIGGKRRLRGLDLWVVATKGPMAEDAVLELAGRVLPE